MLDHAKTLKDKSTTLQCNCVVLTEPAFVNGTTDCLMKTPLIRQPPDCITRLVVVNLVKNIMHSFCKIIDNVIAFQYSNQIKFG